MGELIPELPHVVSVHRVKSRMRFKVGKSFSRLAASAALPLSCCFFCTCGEKIENTWKTVPSFPKSTCRYFISAVRRPLHSLVLSRLQHVEVCWKHAIKHLCCGFTPAKGYSANLRSIMKYRHLLAGVTAVTAEKRLAEFAEQCNIAL